MDRRPAPPRRATKEDLNPQRRPPKDTIDIYNSKRHSIVFVLFAAAAVVLVAWTFLLTVLDFHGVADDSVDRRTRTDTVYAKRGTIYDRNGNILAQSVECITIVANPHDIYDPEATAKELADILGGYPYDYMEKVSRDDTFYVYIVRQGDVSLGEKLKERKAALNEEAKTKRDEAIEEAKAKHAANPNASEDEDYDPESELFTDPEDRYHDYRYFLNPLFGISFEEGMKRVYPYGQVGGQVIGYVGVDGVGISGLELQYDEILAGTDGTKTAEYGNGGIEIPGSVSEYVAPVDGTDITISIDITLQQYAEEQLVEQVKAGNAKSGNVVVLDGATGEIYAAASTPLFDLNNVSEAEAGASILKAISDAYEPGSIFKTVTATVLLEENKVSPSETIPVAWQLELYDRVIKDAKKHDKYNWTLGQILEQSSNVGISTLEMRLNTEVFYGYLVKYGFGAKTGVDYPGEAEGILTSASDWDPVTEANISFGQGISVSTLQMASFYGTLANGGMHVTPHFLIDYPHSEESVQYEPERWINSDTVSTLTGMLIGVVKNGTGKPARVKGYDIAGKTGTGQKLKDSGEYSQFSNWIDFAGYFANSNSALTCVVAMDDPGGSYAMPVFKKVMTFAAERYAVVAYD